MLFYISVIDETCQIVVLWLQLATSFKNNGQ